MTILDFSHAEIKRGRQLARELVRQARTRATGAARALEAHTGIGAATMNHYRLDTLKAVLVYRGPWGGYYADLMFKNLPPGVPDLMGTPLDSPHATRDQAEEMALHLVTGLVERARAGEPAPDLSPELVFELHGVSLRVPRPTCRRFPERQAEWALRARVDAFVRAHLAGSVTPAALERLAPARRRELDELLTLALAHSIFRHPARSFAA